MNDGIAHFLKEIGRGREGARSLALLEAEDLMGRVLDRSVSDLEIGGFALAMRMKGETPDELLGFVRATQARCLAISAPGPVVVIPSYNGARRLPNLTPLLAMRLAQEGAQVLVHGPRTDPGRTSSGSIFLALGLRPVESAEALRERWLRHEPAFMPTDVLSPKLQALLDVRWKLGVRNSGHTVAKLLRIVASGPVLQLASHTHPEFGRLMGEYAQRDAADLMLLRGTEGEPVADPRRRPRMAVWLDGVLQPDLGCDPQDGVLADLPILPRQVDAASTAIFIQALLAGEKPMPEPIDAQVALVLQALARIADRPAAHRFA